MNRRTERLAGYLSGAILLLSVLMLVPQAQGVSAYWNTIGGNTANVSLYDEKTRAVVALAQIKGRIQFTLDGDFETGAEAGFVQLQVSEQKDKWLTITKRELAKGRVILTVETGKVYTIYNADSNFRALIASGRILPK